MSDSINAVLDNIDEALAFGEDSPELQELVELVSRYVDRLQDAGVVDRAERSSFIF